MKLKTPEEVPAQALAGIYGNPTTMGADEVLIRAREAAIEVYKSTIKEAPETRRGNDDGTYVVQGILAYERDRAKPLVEVAPHTVEDPDERAAYDLYVEQCRGIPSLWAEREKSQKYRGIRAAIKRGRELERGA